MNRLLTTGALAVTAAGLLASSAQAAGPNTCIYNPTTKNVNVKLNSGGFVELDREGSKFVTFDAFGKTVCTSSTGIVATVNNTAQVFMNGSFSTPKEDFIINYTGGDFAPGAPSTTGDQSRVEVTVFNDSTDIVDVVGTPSHDFITIMGGEGTGAIGGVRVNGNLDSPAPSVKFPSANPSLLRVNGMDGSDFITGNGVFGTATSMHLRLTGGPGDDSMASGLIAGDVLIGEAGNDSFGTKQGQKGDISNGGPGIDNARIDAPGDSAFEVETINGSIGVPTLKHTALKGRESMVNLSWTHPQAWKQLAKVELGAFVGIKRVGTVTMTPATGKITARGALSLTRDAKLVHKGKTVSAALALKVARSVDTDNLHLQLAATDKAGETQTDLFPGLY